MGPQDQDRIYRLQGGMELPDRQDRDQASGHIIATFEPKEVKTSNIIGKVAFTVELTFRPNFDWQHIPVRIPRATPAPKAEPLFSNITIHPPPPGAIAFLAAAAIVLIVVQPEFAPILLAF
jgi:hypothetical protein